MSERTNNPERIYLEPPPYSPEGRQWCADDVWPLDGDGPGGVEYVRADLAAPEPGGEVRTALIRETTHCAVQRVATLANMREPDGGYWLWEMRSEVVDWVVGEMKEDNEGEAWKPIKGATPAASEDVRERAETMRAMLMVSESLSRNVAAMQAAWIEWQHGRGADAAMQWIENSLSGPGLVPGMDEVDAQAFFDAALAEMRDHRKAVEDEIAALLRTPRGEGEAVRRIATVALALQRRGAPYDEVVSVGVWPEPGEFAALVKLTAGDFYDLAALRSEAQGEVKAVRDVGYMLGTLQAAERMFDCGVGVHAAELVDELMDGFGGDRVRGLAHEQSVEIDWEEVNRIRAARRGEGGE